MFINIYSVSLLEKIVGENIIPMVLKYVMWGLTAIYKGLR